MHTLYLLLMHKKYSNVFNNCNASQLVESEEYQYMSATIGIEDRPNTKEHMLRDQKA